MANVIFRQAAIDDLNNIWGYTYEQWSEAQADKYYAMLKLSCIEIGKNPEIGKQYSEINKGLLGLQVGRHIIFYQFIRNAISKEIFYFYKFTIYYFEE